VQVRLEGAVSEPVSVAVKPKLVLAWAARLPLYEALFTVTLFPDWVYEPLHRLDMAWLFGKVQPTFHAVIGLDPAVTVT
jgi:hypothetical protein